MTKRNLNDILNNTSKDLQIEKTTENNYGEQAFITKIFADWMEIHGINLISQILKLEIHKIIDEDNTFKDYIHLEIKKRMIDNIDNTINNKSYFSDFLEQNNVKQKIIELCADSLKDLMIKKINA